DFRPFFAESCKPTNSGRSPLATFYVRLLREGQYPPEANAVVILTHLDRLNRLRSLGVDQINLTGIGTALVQELAQLTRRYDADDLKRFAPSKRYALVACFLAETQKTLLDQTVAMNDQYLTTMCRRSRN